ncbi:type II toxin-antitoxin system RelE/ParE family toxin [Serratia sp. L9]|uniref:type II toxin-antitoxin system RelE/ParE family toxin n=1 Tax=Serratia sp. L9 TaxID=3423946 RepID=UPI003D6746B4
MTKIKVEYTETAKFSLQEIVNNLKWRQQEPTPVINELLNEFEGKVTVFPLGCPVSPELVKIGVNRYRECNTSNGYRVIYSVSIDTVTAHVILSQRQDIQQLLFKRLIEA